MAILIIATAGIILTLAVMAAFLRAQRIPDEALQAMSPEGIDGIRAMPSEDRPGTWIASYDGYNSILHESPQCALTCARAHRARMAAR